jgi:tetratricopeptide (TPR) repeat protein
MRPVIPLIAACMCVALAVPAGASAQPAVFSEALSEFLWAVEGTFGDEGPHVQRALDRMTTALAEWDRALAAAEGASAASHVDAHVALGRSYAQRGRRAEALRHFDGAARLAPNRGDVQLLRGLILTTLERDSDAADAFRLAWALDPQDPIASYYALHAAADRDPEQVRQAREALTASHAKRLVAGTNAEPVRFPDFRLGGEPSADTPILPLDAYASGYALIAQGDYDAAIAALRNAVATDPLVVDPAGLDASFRQAVLALRAGRLTEARARIEGSSVRDSPESQRVLGLIRWAESDHDPAGRHLEQAARAAPHDERSQLALARVLGSAGREADARRVLQDIVGLFPDSAVAHWSLARSYERDGLFEEAWRAYQRVAPGVLGGRSTLLQGIGRLGAGAADMAAATDAFSAAVASDVNDPAAHMHLAAALLQQDRPEEALAEFVAAALIDPRHPRAHLGVGEIHLNAGRHEEAVRALRQALALAPALTEARYALATALTRLGHSAEATLEFERVAQEQRRALEDRRRRLALDVLKEEAALRASEGAYDRAAALWEQVVAREPGQPLNHVALGAALAGAGRIDAAIEQYEGAITFGADPAALQQLEQLYVEAGRPLDAARTRLLYQRSVPENAAPRVAPR